jgi:hypothetical protein
MTTPRWSCVIAAVLIICMGTVASAQSARSLALFREASKVITRVS